MGVVKEYLTRQIRQDLKAKGLCVWLDAQNEYTDFVLEIQEQHRLNKFEYPVLSFKGSFLELMIQLTPYFSSKDNQPCLVHVPGLNQTTIRKTPLLEAYKAGREIQYNLKNLVRNACAGKLASAQINHLLDEEDFSLELADIRVSEEDQTHPGLKPIISKYSSTDIAIDLMSSESKVDDEIGLPPKNRYEAVGNYLKLQFGFSQTWLDQWKDPTVETDFSLSFFRFPLASFFLCVEYVWDLKCDPLDGRLSPLIKISENQRQNCSRVTEELRMRHAELYRELALEVEPNLTLEVGQQADKFGSTDTFQFEEKRLLDLAFQYLDSKKWGLISSLVKERIGDDTKTGVWKSFWVQHNESHRWAWQWLDLTSRFMQHLENALHDIENWTPEKFNPEKLLEKYTAKNGLFKIDRYHREFEQWTARLKMLTGIPNYRQIISQAKKCRKTYREYVNNLSVLFNRSCKHHGFLPTEDFRQRNFHRQVVDPFLAQGTVAVFYIDAFRYELGVGLSERLAEDKGEINLTARLAELPTVTAVGMNALLPIEKDGQLFPCFDKTKGKFAGLKSGEKIIRDPAQRKKLLKTTTDETCYWMPLKEIADKAPSDIKQRLKDRKLVVIHSLEVDDMGETGLLELIPEYFENTISRIISSVRKLQEVGIKQFVFTADHGFLQADETLNGESLPHIDISAKRYSLHSLELESSKATSVGFSELNYQAETDSSFLVFPMTGDLFHKPGNKDKFYHGGNSLQERTVPVLTYKKTYISRIGDGRNLNITTRSLPPMLGYHRFILNTGKNYAMFDQNMVQLQIEPDQPAGNVSIVIGEVNPGSFQGSRIKIPANQDIEIVFKIFGNTEIKTPLKILQPEEIEPIKPYVTKEFFQVEIRSGTTATERTVIVESTDSNHKSWPDDIPEYFHPILSHIDGHGAITEQALIKMLGGGGKGARKARKFAAGIKDWLNRLPFDLEIKSTTEGKEYRKL